MRFMFPFGGITPENPQQISEMAKGMLVGGIGTLAVCGMAYLGVHIALNEYHLATQEAQQNSATATSLDGSQWADTRSVALGLVVLIGLKEYSVSMARVRHENDTDFSTADYDGFADDLPEADREFWNPYFNKAVDGQDPEYDQNPYQDDVE